MILNLLAYVIKMIIQSSKYRRAFIYMEEYVFTLNYPTWPEIMQEYEMFIKGCFGDVRKSFPMIRPETPTFLGVPLVKTPEELIGADAVIIGAPYVATSSEKYAGVDKNEWLAAPQRVRQQSIRYQSGYIQDFDIDVFEHIKVVDYADAEIPSDVMNSQSPDDILKAQAAVEKKVGHALDANAIPIVIGHGIKDNIIPIKISERVFQLLTKNNANVDFIKYNGEHKISIDYLKQVKTVIANKR